MLLCNGLAVRWTPKYFHGIVYLWKARIIEAFLWIAMLVLKKQILDLERLTSIPEAMEKSFRICLYARVSLTMGIPWSMVSSTSCWWVKAYPLSESWRPLILPTSFECLIDQPSPSIMRMKGRGESGSPCLRSLERIKVSEGERLTKIEKLEEVTRAKTHLTQLWSNPKLIRTFLI